MSGGLFAQNWSVVIFSRHKVLLHNELELPAIQTIAGYFSGVGRILTISNDSQQQTSYTSLVIPSNSNKTKTEGQGYSHFFPKK